MAPFVGLLCDFTSTFCSLSEQLCLLQTPSRELALSTGSGQSAVFSEKNEDIIWEDNTDNTAKTVMKHPVCSLGIPGRRRRKNARLFKFGPELIRKGLSKGAPT